jgi:hypothetical protein
MINPISFVIFVVGTTAAILTGFLWQDEYTSKNCKKTIRILFGGKTRSFLTAHIVILSGLLVLLFTSPEADFSEIFGVFIGGEVMLLGVGIGGFLNWHIGPWSHAPRHGLVVTRIIELSHRGMLDDSTLEIHLRSMIGEIEKGNNASKKKLLLLENRDDQLGERTRQLIGKIQSSKLRNNGKKR